VLASATGSAGIRNQTRAPTTNWGLYTTVTDDSVRDALVLAERARMRDGARVRVAKRIGELPGRIEAAPKSSRWKLRSRVGRRVRWYRVVEEIL
jgi:hypothetical protein